MLKPCPFCKLKDIYEITEVDNDYVERPAIFCNCCKIIFRVENDSPYFDDAQTNEYLKKKNAEAWNKRM